MKNACAAKKLLLYISFIGIICFGILAIRLPVVGKMLSYAAEQLPQHKKIIPLPETRGIETDQNFNFTISPNGQELLFITKKGNQYRLVALNLIDHSVQQHPLNEEDYTSLMVDLSNDCWSQDSRYCIAPLPGSKNIYATVSPEWVIDFSESSRLQITHKELAIASRAYSDFQQPFTCSDCFWESEPHDKNGVRTRYSSGVHDPSVMSPDQRWVYQARSENNDSATIYVTDTVSTTVKKLLRINSPRFLLFSNRGKVTIDRLRLSPSGRYLAFQVTYELGWIDIPTLYILNVKTRALILIAENVYHDVHWTANPERLYFYKCKRGGACGGSEDHLYSMRP